MTSIDNLSNEIAKQLVQYTKEVEEEVQQAADDVSNATVEEIKSNSPKKSGAYAKGWGRKKADNGFVIYNKKKPQITHLLEHGHVKVNGGRVPGRAHIRPAEEKAIADFTERVEKAIKR